MEKLRIGISQCLLGERVRYDGGHKRQSFLLQALGPYVEWVSVCPEVEIGMGTPREPLELVRHDGTVRMLTRTTKIDHTETMVAYAKNKARSLRQAGIDGYILKSNSPSCGLSVQITSPGGEEEGKGLFADAIGHLFPHLPFAQESDLEDPAALDNFGESVVAHRRMRLFFQDRRSLGQLAMFHSQHELQVISHSPQKYADLSRIVEHSKQRPRSEVFAEYAALLTQAIRIRASVDGHVTALHRAARLLDSLPLDEPKLHGAIERFASGEVSLAIPLLMLRERAEASRSPRLLGQTYIEADDIELGMRGLL